MKGWIHFLSLSHQAQPVPIHIGHLATWKTNLIHTFLGKSSYPRISLCDEACEHLEEEKNIPKQTVINPGETGQSFEAEDRALTLCPTLGSPQAAGPSSYLQGCCYRNLKLGSPVAQVDSRNTLDPFLNAGLFVYPQVSFLLENGLPQPHPNISMSSLTGAVTPSTAWKMRSQKCYLASRGNRVPVFAF